MRKQQFLVIYNLLKIMHFQTPYQNTRVHSFGDKGGREKDFRTKTAIFGAAMIHSFSEKTAQLLASQAMMKWKRRIVF